jgi:two-component system nitrate/nitrite response regulator NarL
MLDVRSRPSVASRQPPDDPASATRPRWTEARFARQIDLLVVDGCPVVHQGVRLFMEHSDRIVIDDHAYTGQEAVDLARRSRPDLVLVDPFLPDMLLGEVVRRIRAVSPASKIVVFAAHVTPTVHDEAAGLGVHGFLGKDATPEHFVDVITRVANGEVLADPMNHEVLRRAAEKLRCTPLTPREHEILRRAARGESNAEIAKAIFLAPTTVKSYLQSALRKLGARNRVEAVFKLSELRLL